MQIWRYAEQGSIRLLWISATNPAVSLPDLARVWDILSRDDLFVVVQDGFRTETAEYANVVLPAAMWGEKQGTFTNASTPTGSSPPAWRPARTTAIADSRWVLSPTADSGWAPVPSPCP